MAKANKITTTTKVAHLYTIQDEHVIHDKTTTTDAI
jgi:hypothetical protein